MGKVRCDLLKQSHPISVPSQNRFSSLLFLSLPLTQVPRQHFCLVDRVFNTMELPVVLGCDCPNRNFLDIFNEHFGVIQ
jgi:hypothetical protein